jgi:hypothetical protein
MTQTPPSQTQGSAKAWALLAVAALTTFLAFNWLFLDQLFAFEDVNMEAMDTPLTVGYLEQAREKGIAASAYFHSDPIWDNLKKENPEGAYAYFGKRFQFEFFAFQWPMLSIFFVPFVKLVGVCANTVTLYSTFFAAVAWVLTGLLALKLFGRWCVWLAMLFLISSLSWLIHAKVGYSAHMPSASLMVVLALCSYTYARRTENDSGIRNCALPLAGMGCVLGMMYMEGWLVVVFGTLVTGLTIVLNGPRRIARAMTDFGCVAGAAVAAILLVTAGYAVYYHCTFAEIHSAIHDVMFGRFSQGGVPGQEMTLAGKMAYAFRCMFWDMRTPDHLDKCLEGFPAIPPVFSVLFAVGLLYTIKERTLADKTLLIWLVSVFAVLGSAFMFTHRYALMALPAMSLVAARGVTGVATDLFRWRGTAMRLPFVAGVALWLVISLMQTHEQFYVGYMLRKPPDFEVDRARGHAAFATWLRQTGSPQDTLVVLGDPVMFPHSCFLFNTFGRDYRFMYWSNHFGTASTAEEIRHWEWQEFAHYRRIVCAFSPILLGNSQTGAIRNDWRPFLAAHPGLRPSWTYSYAGRQPSILVFEIDSPKSASEPPAVRPALLR